MGRKREIYILLTHSGSLLSKFIGIYTKEPYTHVSIALDRDLNEVYSFGRLYPSNPIYGGFVREDISNGTFGRFPETRCALYSLNITEHKYKRLRSELMEFMINQNRYGYNFLGLFGVMLGIPIERSHNYFCSQFVATLLNNSGIHLFEKPCALVSPMDFGKCKELSLIYEGKLRSYRFSPTSYGNLIFKT